MNKKISAWLAIITIATACGHKEKDERSDAEASGTLSVTTSKISLTDEFKSISLSGIVEPDKTAQIGFNVQGTASSVLANEGDNVKQGQLIATLDSRDYEYQLQQSEGSLLRAKDTYERDKQLYEDSSLTAKEYVSAQSDYITAQGNRNSSAKKVSDTKLYAPITGTITRKMIEKGMQASPGSTAFSIDAIDHVNITMTVPETDIATLMHNDTATITISAINQTFTGKITAINKQASQGSNTYRTKIKVTNPQHKILPGMIAEVKIITTQKEKYLTIPPKAIVHDEDGLQYVFLVGDSSRVIKHRVTTGDVFGEEIAVNEGMKDGDVLVIEGQQRLLDGQKVTVK